MTKNRKQARPTRTRKLFSELMAGVEAMRDDRQGRLKPRRTEVRVVEVIPDEHPAAASDVVAKTVRDRRGRRLS